MTEWHLQETLEQRWTDQPLLWNSMDTSVLKDLVSSYKKRRVFERFPGKVGEVSFFAP